MYCILWTKVLLSTNGEKGVAWGVCLLCRMASSLVMKTSSSRKLQWPFKMQGERKEDEEKRKESAVTNSLKFELYVEIKIISEWAFSLIFMQLQFDEVFINFPTFSRSMNVFHKYFVKTWVDKKLNASSERISTNPFLSGPSEPNGPSPQFW